jgi:hypothetical protein
MYVCMHACMYDCMCMLAQAACVVRADPAEDGTIGFFVAYFERRRSSSGADTKGISLGGGATVVGFDGAAARGSKGRGKAKRKRGVEGETVGDEVDVDDDNAGDHVGDDDDHDKEPGASEGPVMKPTVSQRRRARRKRRRKAGGDRSGEGNPEAAEEA